MSKYQVIISKNIEIRSAWIFNKISCKNTLYFNANITFKQDYVELINSFFCDNDEAIRFIRKNIKNLFKYYDEQRVILYASYESYAHNIELYQLCSHVIIEFDHLNEARFNHPKFKTVLKMIRATKPEYFTIVLNQRPTEEICQKLAQLNF